MIKVCYTCPECQAECHHEFAESMVEPLACARCGGRVEIPSDAVQGGQLRRCVVCPSTELYVRKDFSQRWGVGIVVAGLAASCLAWFFRHFILTYAILFFTAIVDAVLYQVRGSLLQCYRCEAEYRGVADLAGSAPFHLETQEKYRQQAARLNEARARID